MIPLNFLHILNIYTRKRDFRDFGTLWHHFADLKSSIFGHFAHRKWWKNSIWALEKTQKRFLTFCKLEMVRNALLHILSTHTSKSAENRPRKIDFTIFSKWGGWRFWGVDLGGQNFKSAKWCQSVPKSRKSRFRVYMLRPCRKFRRITSDTQKNV